MAQTPSGSLGICTLPRNSLSWKQYAQKRSLLVMQHQTKAKGFDFDVSASYIALVAYFATEPISLTLSL